MVPVISPEGGAIIAIFHCPIKIIQRSRGKSAVGAAAYRSGTCMVNEWDGLTHDYTRKHGVVHSEILLPDHAPRTFLDRSALWNSVEQIEKSRDSQLAREVEVALPIELNREQQLSLVRGYVQEQFVTTGMCADFSIHDKDDGNPHAHILLTIRPLQENGEWGAKCRKVYDLDEKGQRIPDGHGGWKSHRENTVDWNDRDKAEIWRAAWAEHANRALESAGRPERIDHRSYKRQGIDKIPTIHLGVAATQMERRGIVTEKGNINRQIATDNRLLKEIKARITRLYGWSREEAEKPSYAVPTLLELWEARQNQGSPTSRYGKVRTLQENAALFNFLSANHITNMQQLHEKIAAMNKDYYDLRGSIVTTERRMVVLDERLVMWSQYQKYKPIHDQLSRVKPGKEPLFRERHRAELMKYEAAAKYWKGIRDSGHEITPKRWRTELAQLSQQKDSDYAKMRIMRDQIKMVEGLRKAAQQLDRQQQSRENDPER